MGELFWLLAVKMGVGEQRKKGLLYLIAGILAGVDCHARVRKAVPAEILSSTRL